MALLALLLLFSVACGISAGPLKPSPPTHQDVGLPNSFDAIEFNNNGFEISSNNGDVSEALRNTDPYRLPTAVYPQNYTLVLRLEQNFGTTQVFTGNVEIWITVRENTNVIQLHAKNLTIPTGSVILNCIGAEGNLFSELEFDEDYEMVYVRTQQNVQANTDCQLTFYGFSGVLADDMYGFYRSYYLDENDETVYV